MVNVSFAYDGERELYHKLNYVFEYGKKYGIVGRTGEGKSTFVKLMFNIWSPCGGNVYIGESDCTQIANKEINDMILYISSEPIIINDTVYNNIALERKGVEEKEILLALKKVCLYNEITKMEQGIYTVVGDKGSALSSGEKQRLALARALISKKQIVILDEPTAALDEVTRDMVMQNIYEELAGRTLIIIAHDRSILKSCDKILCLKDGKLKEFNAEINCN